MKVVAFSSVGGGWHEVRLSDRKICHLVPTTSRGDIVTGKNRADLAGDGDVMRRYLDEGIAVQRLSTHSCYSGGNPRIWSSRSDNGGNVVSFFSWEHRLWSSRGRKKRCQVMSCLAG